MGSSMTWSSIVALFSTMVILAALPSVSVLAVITRSATFGFIHGGKSRLQHSQLGRNCSIGISSIGIISLTQEPVQHQS